MGIQRCVSVPARERNEIIIVGEKKECWKGIFIVRTKVKVLGTRKDHCEYTRNKETR